MTIEQFEKIANELEISVNHNEDSVEISFRSPRGQDCRFDLLRECPIGDLQRLVDSYDPSYEAYLWLDNTGHGKNGAPYDMGDVYADAVSVLARLELLLKKAKESR